MKQNTSKIARYSPLFFIRCCVQYFVGWLLHNANRDIPFLAKSQFYELKTRLLKKYATKVGTDIQHIKKDCWSCDSTGVFKSEWKMPEPCWSCYGTGVYEEFWTRLDKYKLGKWYFHNPVERMYKYEPLFEGESLPIIEGYIHHKAPKYRLGKECALWLFLLFDRKSFWKELGRTGSPTHKRTPLVIVDNAIFVFRHFDWRDYFPKKKPKYNFDYDSDELPF